MKRQASNPVLGGTQNTMFETGRLPERNQGWVVHPDMPRDDDNGTYRQKLETMGFERTVILLSSYPGVTDAQRATFFNEGSIRIGWWEPSTPPGEGWLLASIYYGEHGPAATFVRPTTAQSCRIRRSLEPSSNDALFGELTQDNIQAAIAAVKTPGRPAPGPANRIHLLAPKTHVLFLGE